MSILTENQAACVNKILGEKIALVDALRAALASLEYAALALRAPCESTMVSNIEEIRALLAKVQP